MVTCIFLQAYHSGHCYKRDKNAFNKVIKQLIRRTTIGRLGWKCMWSAARALCYLLVRMPVTCATVRGRACGREKRALTGRRDPRSLDRRVEPLLPRLSRLMQSHFFIFWQCGLSMQWRGQLAHLLHSGSPPHTISFLPVDELGNDRTALTVPGMPLNTSSSVP